MITAGIDATPLLGRRTGIGRYTEHLLTALARREDVAIRATAFTARGWRALRSAVPDGVATRSLPAPARALRALWTRAESPAVGLFCGRVDVFHGTNFVLPPTGRAGGVLTIHDLAYLTSPDTVDATSRALIELVPRGLRRAAAVCTPSAAIAEQIRDAYGPAVPELIVTPLGVDGRWFDAAVPDAAERHRLSLPADYFLFVGTREPRKDVATLTAAYAELRRDHGGDVPSLLLVGPEGWGPGQHPEPGVIIHGYLAQEDLSTIVAGARALVMPSRDEGFGLPALEGLACGTPVIVSSVPALVEVTGGHAAVFDTGDVPGLIAALAVAMSADPLTDREIRRDYARRWTWQACAEATMKAYRIGTG